VRGIKRVLSERVAFGMLLAALFAFWRVARYPLEIGGNQPFVIALHGNAGETRLSVDRSRLCRCFRTLQHLVQRGTIKFLSP
jgi:hypothetical protein